MWPSRRVQTGSRQSCCRVEESSWVVPLFPGWKEDGLIRLEPHSSSPDLLQFSPEGGELQKRYWRRQTS